MVRLMETITKQRSRFEWFAFEEKSILHCVADGCTPEETILYIIGENFQNANHYNECTHLRLQPFEKIITAKNMEGNADEWFALAKLWRNEGKLKDERLHEFLKILNSAKSRWPEIFSGKTPYVKKYWEVHFNYVPAGVATVGPATKPVAVFDSFSDATKYVEEHSTENYWWHSYDLFDAAERGDIPKWQVTPTPRQFKRVDKSGYIGYNSIWNCSADCIFATPRDSYMRWLDAVREGDAYKINEVRNGYIYNYVMDVGSWCVRYVEHEEPIDNANPKANIPKEYLVERCED